MLTDERLRMYTRINDPEDRPDLDETEAMARELLTLRALARECVAAMPDPGDLSYAAKLLISAGHATVGNALLKASSTVRAALTRAREAGVEPTEAKD